MPKTFKQFEEYDKACDEVIFEHEQEGITEAEYQGKKVKLMTQLEVVLKSFMCMLKMATK